MAAIAGTVAGFRSMADGSQRCRLCNGSGKNRTGRRMRVNNHICPRCGGYGTVPALSRNPEGVTQQDREYMARNGLIHKYSGGLR